MKLGSAGLAHYFSVGGFGSDHELRGRLPTVALERAEVHWGRTFLASESVIIGDTPRDIDCGREVGAVTVAVATGNFTAGELEAAGADVVLEDLGDVESCVELLTGRLP